MQTIQQFPSWFSKQKLSGKVAIGCSGIFMLCCLCSVPYAILSPATPTSTPVPTSTPIPTSTPTSIPEFSFNEIIQSPKEKGWTDTQYSTYFETIKGKKVNGWSGTILEIDEWGGEPYLSLDIEPNEPEIDAYVYISKDDILKVGLGQNITFAGTIDSNWTEPNNYYALQIKDVTLLEIGEIPTSTPEPPTAIPSATETIHVPTPTEKISALLPGLNPADVTVNLEERGFTCSSVEQSQLYYTRICDKDTADYSLHVEIYGRELFSVDFIDSTISQYTPDYELAASFLGFMATMPYDGALQEESRIWVEATAPTIKGQGDMEEKVFADVTYRLKGIPTFMTLEMGDLP